MGIFGQNVLPKIENGRTDEERFFSMKVNSSY